MKHKIIGISLIIISLLYLIFKYITIYKNKLIENKLINDFKVENNINQYIGYLEIPRINLNKIIKYGNSKNILDNEYVGLLSGKTFDNKNIVLAGHNREGVFKNIKYLKVNDIIILNTYKYRRTYKVYKIIKIFPNEINYFYDTDEELLTLVTCSNYNKKRLLVIAKLYDKT